MATQQTYKDPRTGQVIPMPFLYQTGAGANNPFSTTPAMITRAENVATPALTANYRSGNATGTYGPQAPQAPAPQVQNPQGNGSGSFSSSGTIIRNSDGSVSELKQPLSNLEQWKNQTAFIEAAKEIIRKKQDYNKDIQGSRDYWRSVIADTSPFGGMRDTAMDATGATFTDKDLRLLSPEDQASVRASRWAAGQAHLQGLNEEATYRETQTKDMIGILKDFYAEKAKEIQNMIDNAKDEEKMALEKEKFAWSKKIDLMNAAAKSSSSNDKLTLGEAASLTAQELAKKVGADGKVSPDDYNYYKKIWVQNSGFTGTDFDEYMTMFRNNANPYYSVTQKSIIGDGTYRESI